MMFWYGNGMGGWGYALMMISSVLIWALIVFAVVALIRYLTRPTQQSTQQLTQQSTQQPPWSAPPPTPQQLLAERYARGEIDDAEYRQRLATLQTSQQAPAPRP